MWNLCRESIYIHRWFKKLNPIPTKLRVADPNLVCLDQLHWFCNKLGRDKKKWVTLSISLIHSCWKSYPYMFVVDSWGKHLGHIHMGLQVSSSTHVSKSQHGGKVPTLEPQETIKIWLIIIEVKSWLFYAKNFVVLVSRVGPSCLLHPNLNTSLTSRKFHVILRLKLDLGLCSGSVVIVIKYGPTWVHKRGIVCAY